VSLRSPLGRVLGRGAAHEGVSEWWTQRVTAVALVPLTLWFLFSILALPALDHATVVEWMQGGWTTVLLVLFVVTAAWHSQLGVRVVIEDYVHAPGAKTALLILVTFAHVLLGAAGVFAVLRIAFGGAAA
jgi:succinate dehydrogenase, hydrophobic membrane anchor protein